MTLGAIGRHLLAAAFALPAFGPGAEAVAGTASASFQVTAQVIGGSQCRGIAGSSNPVTVSCGSQRDPVVLQPRPELPGMTLVDGWLTYGSRTEAYDSVYAASLTTRLIRYQQWEYIETLVSW